MKKYKWYFIKSKKIIFILCEIADNGLIIKIISEYTDLATALHRANATEGYYENSLKEFLKQYHLAKSDNGVIPDLMPRIKFNNLTKHLKK